MRILRTTCRPSGRIKRAPSNGTRAVGKAHLCCTTRLGDLWMRTGRPREHRRRRVQSNRSNYSIRTPVRTRIRTEIWTARFGSPGPARRTRSVSDATSLDSTTRAADIRSLFRGSDSRGQGSRRRARASGIRGQRTRLIAARCQPKIPQLLTSGRWIADDAPYRRFPPVRFATVTRRSSGSTVQTSASPR